MNKFDELVKIEYYKDKLKECILGVQNGAKKR